MPTVKLSNAKTFDCQPEQTLLEAARAHGIALEHGCRTGRCDICKAQVLNGITTPIKIEESLSADDQATGLILTCCRTAVTDISLDIEDLGELGNIDTKTLPCRIDSLSLLTDDAIEVTLRTPPTSCLAYLPGQYIDVIGKNGLRRSYSVANAPRLDGKLTLQIRKVPNGELSRHWLDEATLAAFAQDMRAHGGDPAAIEHACIDMSAAHAKGIGQPLPNAQVSYDRFHVVALANAAMDEVRRDEMRSSAAKVREAAGTQNKKTLRQLLWGMRKNPAQWTDAQLAAMQSLQHSTLKSARTWRLRQALRLVYQEAVATNGEEIAQG